MGDCRPLGECSRAHAGYDLGNTKDLGEPVVAAASGVVVAVTAANTIWIDHRNKYLTRYVHNDTTLVEPGEIVVLRSIRD